MPNPEKVLLSELTWQTIKDATYEVALLPWGATEAHNYHLPYGTDNYEVDRIAVEAASIASREGASVVVLPAVPFGVNTQQLDIPLTLNMNPSTQAAVLSDITESLGSSGVRKLVILNGHGGNDFRQMVRELQAETSLFLCVVNWYGIVPQEPFFDEMGDHAGEMETSVMMHLEPSLVLPLDQAGDGRAKSFRISGLRDGTAWAPRRWTKVTADTGVGDPSNATPAKGKAYVEAVIRKIAEFLMDLSEADVEEMYEEG